MSVLICASVLMACGNRGGSTTRVTLGSSPFGTVFDSSQKPTIASFTASPATINAGDSATLLWDVDDPLADLTINSGVGAVFGGSRVVAPAKTTTYTLFASNASGSTTATVTVTVTGTTADSGPVDTTPVETVEWESATTNLEGLQSECGNLSFVSPMPFQDSVIVGVARQGLWIDSEDGTWERLGTGPGSDQVLNRTSSIVYDPVVPEVFWQSGIYNGAGVFRTDDNGITMRQLGSVEHSDLVAIDFTDPDRQTLLSGRHETSTLYRSTDGGRTWNDISATLPPGLGYATSPVVVNDSTYLLGTNNGQAPGVFRTDNGGFTWTKVFDGGISGVPVISTSDGAMYWLLERGAGVIRSDDFGATWIVVNQSAPFATYPASLVQLGGGQLAALGSSSVLVSSDLGATWNPVGPPLPYQPMGLAYAPYRQMLYIWQHTCDSGSNPIADDAILRIPYP